MQRHFKCVKLGIVEFYKLTLVLREESSSKLTYNLAMLFLVCYCVQHSWVAPVLMVISGENKY